MANPETSGSLRRKIPDRELGYAAPGWLRSRFMRWEWPREGVSACGRNGCPFCDEEPPL
jgi:hypothetical protein